MPLCSGYRCVHSPIEPSLGSGDGETITIHPTVRRGRGGREVDNALVKALARPFRWQKMLDYGVCRTIEELAKRERVNRGYMKRVEC